MCCPRPCRPTPSWRRGCSSEGTRPMTAPELASPERSREHVIITRWGVDWPWKRRRAERRQVGGGAGTGSVLLVVASVLLAADGAAMGVVSWHAQFAFVFAAKQQ